MVKFGIKENKATCDKCHHPDDCDGCPESQRVPEQYKLKNTNGDKHVKR